MGDLCASIVQKGILILMLLKSVLIQMLLLLLQHEFLFTKQVFCSGFGCHA